MPRIAPAGTSRTVARRRRGSHGASAKKKPRNFRGFEDCAE